MNQIRALLLLLLTASIAHADLRYTTKVELRVAAAAIKAFMPPGETATFLSNDALRIEQLNGHTKTILLVNGDGSFLLAPDARTYVRLPDLVDLLSGTPLPTPTFRRTGEFATLFGLKAERADLTVSIPLPTTLPGVPTVATMRGDIWVADAYREHGRTLRKAIGFVPALPAGIEGIVLRQTLRNEQMGIEIDYVVTQLAEGPIPAAMFEVPPGYRRQP